MGAAEQQGRKNQKIIQLFRLGKTRCSTYAEMCIKKFEMKIPQYRKYNFRKLKV